MTFGSKRSFFLPRAAFLTGVVGLSAACVPLVSTAPDAVSAPPPPPPEVRLISAIEAQGCVLTAENVEAVLLSANLTQAELAEITPRLADAGRVEVAGEGSLKVLTDRCTA